MTPGNATAIADLVASHEEWKNGHSKALAIIMGVEAILSTMSSSLLVLIIARSRDRLRTTYHRLVVGVSVSDILYSSCIMTFSAMRPSDMSYMLWNARGNQATCTAMGFLIAAGATASVFYSRALNMSYLAVVRYNCSEARIRSRIEPFLHAFPIGVALAFSIVPLAGNNYNGSEASCQFAPINEPPYCTGIEDGEVREGIEIPCGRGREGFPNFYYLSFFILMFIPPVVIGVSLGLMYRALRNQENRMARYGAGTLNLNTTRAADGDAADGEDGGGGGRGEIGRTITSSVTSIRASLARRLGRRVPANLERPLSRAVVQRATAYSFAFFLTWSWTIIVGISILALGGIPDPRPNWYIALLYLVAIFQPLQGLFNLLIYMQPKVTSARSSLGRELSWHRAIVGAFRTSLGLEWKSRDVSPAADARLGDDSGRRKGRTPPVEDERVEVASPDEETSESPAPVKKEKADVKKVLGIPGKNPVPP